MFRNLFKSEHVYKDKEDNTAMVAKSLQALQSDFGGTDNLFQEIATDVHVSSRSLAFIDTLNISRFKHTYLDSCIIAHLDICCL